MLMIGAREEGFQNSLGGSQPLKNGMTACDRVSVGTGLTKLMHRLFLECCCQNIMFSI